jgi:hypothetical protein
MDELKDVLRNKSETSFNAGYEGEWKDDQKHGQGKETYANGNVYKGEWKDDQKHGQGTFTWADGDVCKGEWKDDQKHGHGTLTYANGNVYEGGWKDGQKHGHGTLTYANGNVYKGGWKDGQKHGHGTLTYANGNVYKGEWKDDSKYDNDENKLESICRPPESKEYKEHLTNVMKNTCNLNAADYSHCVAHQTGVYDHPEQEPIAHKHKKVKYDNAPQVSGVDSSNSTCVKGAPPTTPPISFQQNADEKSTTPVVAINEPRRSERLHKKRKRED